MKTRSFVSEAQYKRYRTILIVLLVVSEVIGIPLLIFGVKSVFLTSLAPNGSNFMAVAGLGMFALFLGVVFSVIIPLGILRFLLQRPIMSYTASASAPIVNDTAKAVSPAMEEFGRSLHSGWTSSSTGVNNSSENQTSADKDRNTYGYCDKCGHPLDADDIFCPVCGKRVR